MNYNLKEINFEDAEYSVFDFETTGTSPYSERVIEIGIAKIKKGKIKETFSSYINPGRPIPYFITKLTGITNHDVENAPYFEEIFPKINEFIGDSVLAAHNLNFDLGFLKQECLRIETEMPKNPSICTLKIARRIYPELGSKSLGNLSKYLKIRHRNVHTGLGDASATAKILLKMFPLLREKFDVETVTDLIAFQNAPSNKNPFVVIKKNLLKDIVELPASPGVYFFKDSKNNIIYVGKAKSLKERVKNYFSSNAIRKAKDIVRKSSSFSFQKTKSELSALLLETELIKVHDPKQNSLQKKYPRNYFIKIPFDDPYPKPIVVSNIEFDGSNFFGPYPNREIAAKIKDIIDRTFLLRECSDKELSKKRKCYLADINRCYAPCIENPKLIYMEELERVNEFLSGKNQSAVNRLLDHMKALSEQKKYEEAAQIRDIVQDILNQLHKSSILSEPVNNAKALVEIQSSTTKDFFLLINGKVLIKEDWDKQGLSFEQALNDYFDGNIQNKIELSEKDLERLKITLSWLVKNKGKFKITYLSELENRITFE